MPTGGMPTTSTTHGSVPRYLVAILAITAAACNPGASDDQALRDGELMFDLDDEEVARLHQQYVGAGDAALTRARLSAPFDCSLFDDFCAQVGSDAALEITGKQVELARDGAQQEEMNAQTAA